MLKPFKEDDKEGMMTDLQCPYCNADHEVCHDDGFGCEEGVPHHDECGKCGKQFIFYTSISLFYEPQEADCLNGAPHEFEPTFTVPVEATKMACRMCDERRTPTAEEMAAIRAERAARGDFQK